MKMRPIEGILFDPVGSLAEFPADEFKAIALRLLGGGFAANASASQAYWDVLNLLDARWPLDAADRDAIEAHEIRAFADSSLYEDAAPALSELKALGVRLVVASSLSEAAVGLFLDRFALRHAFAGCW